MTYLELDFRIPLKIKRYIELDSSHLELENSRFRGEKATVKQDKQGNYSLRRPPKLIMQQRFIEQR